MTGAGSDQKIKAESDAGELIKKTCLTCKHKRYGDLAEAECTSGESKMGIIKPWTTCDFWEH